MNKLILLVLISVVFSRNVILIGDSRYVGMAVYLMNFPYSTTTPYYGTGTNIRSTSPRTYNGDSFQVTAQVGAAAGTFTSSKDLLNSVNNQLKRAAKGTNVLIWLGINNVNSDEATYKYAIGLAQKHSTLNFYVISITGVNGQKVPSISNKKVQSFNAKLKSKINSSRLPNLKYKSILNGNDVNTILVNGQPVHILNYMTGDGLHYTKDGYIQLWRAMSTIF